MNTKKQTQEKFPTFSAAELCALMGLSEAEFKRVDPDGSIAESVLPHGFPRHQMPPAPAGARFPLLVSAEEFYGVLSRRSEITTAELASAFRISTRRVQQLVEAGEIDEPIRRGVFNQDRAMRSLFRYLAHGPTP